MLNARLNYSNGGGLRISVGELSRSIPVAGDPVVDGQRKQLVFPN